MNTQAQFFNRLKPTVSPFSSLAAEVAITLNVSLDSAYRRIRGEKLLNFEEISLLCRGFNISVDEFFCLNSRAILFQSGTNPSQKDALKQWLEDVHKQLYYINSYPRSHLYHLIKDLPPFHHFFHPVLARFKFFFWRKSFYQLDRLNSRNSASTRSSYSITKNYPNGSFELMPRYRVRKFGVRMP